MSFAGATGASMPLALVWDLIAIDKASPIFGRVSANANAAATGMDRAVAKFAAGSRTLATTGAAMTRRFTIPILAIAAASVKAATDFDASMTRIRTQAGASGREVQFLSKQVLGMKDAQFGPTAAAGALYHLESVGIRGKKAMFDLRQAEDLAAVGGANLTDTTNALAGAWRTGIRGAKNFHQAAATVNAIIGAGNMTLPDFTGALGTGILPSAKTFGLTLKDVGSALALFTDEGVPAEVAATRLRMSFSLLGAPSAKAEKELNSIGLTGLRLANDMRRPDGLIVAVGDLKKHLDNSGLSASKQSILLSHAFGGGRSSSAILSLINNYGVLLKKQDQVTASLGHYDHAVKVQAQTPQAKFKESLAQLEQTGVLLGRDILPLFVTAAGDIEHLAKGFDHLSPGMKHVIIDAGLALAAMGPLLAIGGRIGLLFSGLYGGVARLGNGLAAMSGGVGGATRGFAGLIGIAGGAAIGFAFGKLTENASGADQALGALGATAAGAAIGLGIGGPVGAAVGGLAGLIGDLATRFLGAASDAKQLQAEVNDSMARNTSATDTFNAALRQTHNLLKRAVVGAATTNLQNFKLPAFATPGQAPPNALDVAGQLGLNLHTFALAATGNVRASRQMRVALAELYKTGAISADGWRALSGAVGQTNDNFAEAARNAVNVAHAHARNFATLRNLRKEVELYGKGVDLSGVNLIHFSKAVDSNTAAGVFNRAWIQDELGLLDKHAVSMARDGKSVGASIKWFDEHSAALERHLIKVGFDKQSIEALFGTLGKPPKAPILDAKVSKLEATISAARAKIDSLRQSKKPGIDAAIDRLRATIHTAQDEINGLHGKRVEVDIAFRNIVLGKPPSYAGPYTGGPTPGVIGATGATGGRVIGPGTGTSDSVLARLSNGEFVVRASEARKHAQLLGAINTGAFRGYAGGGAVGMAFPQPRFGSAPATQRGGSSSARVIGGSVGIDADSQGRLFATFRDLVLEELAHDGQMERQYIE